MLRRIHWAESLEEEDEQADDRPQNYCHLVWEGSVVKPTFSRFTVEVS